jgi:hypothetical protein
MDVRDDVLMDTSQFSRHNQVGYERMRFLEGMRNTDAGEAVFGGLVLEDAKRLLQKRKPSSFQVI